MITFIIANPRCGTHMLQTALGTHPRLRVKRELFNQRRWNFNKPDDPQGLLDSFFQGSNRNDVPGKVKPIFTGGKKSNIGNGFIFHPEQSRWLGDGYALLPSDTKKIWLHRPLFDQCISWAIAKRKSQFYMGKGKKPNRKPITVDVDAFNDVIRRYGVIYPEHAEPFFKGSLCVSYQSLCVDWKETLRRVFDFIGVEFHMVKPRTVKAAPNPAKIIRNYAELKEAFEAFDFDTCINRES